MSSITSTVLKETSTQVEKVPFFWIKDAAGHKSVSVTLLVVSFFVTTVAFVLSIFSKIGPLEIRSFDVAACSTYMIPILTLYFSRRWTDASHGITQMREAAAMVNPPGTTTTTTTVIDPNAGIVSNTGFPPTGM